MVCADNDNNNGEMYILQYSARSSPSGVEDGDRFKAHHWQIQLDKCTVFALRACLLLSMYVCMSENLYPAHLKQKSHSRAAVSNKQKRLQCPFEPFSGQVG